MGMFGLKLLENYILQVKLVLSPWWKWKRQLVCVFIYFYHQSELTFPTINIWPDIWCHSMLKRIQLSVLLIKHSYSVHSTIIFLDSYLGTSVKNAVVTVPAYFNDSQRQVNIVFVTFGKCLRSHLSWGEDNEIISPV